MSFTACTGHSDGPDGPEPTDVRRHGVDGVPGDFVRERRAAGAADDGAHLRRPLEERPTPPRRPPTHSPRHEVKSGGDAVQPCPRRDSGAAMSKHQRKD
jgi:hypothetical protein